jgi:hypothetical protein
MGISFNNNDYGITRKEWHTIKKELKAADKKNDNFELSKADYKELKTSIKNGDLGAYLDKQGAELREALGLSLKGKVDGTEDLTGAKGIVNDVNFAVRPDGKQVDKAKVIQYIQTANAKRIEQGTNTAIKGIEYAGVVSHLQYGLFAEAFAESFA